MEHQVVEGMTMGVWRANAFLFLYSFEYHHCCSKSRNIIYSLMTSKWVLIFALVLLASCWEFDDFEEVPCADPHCQLCDPETNITCIECQQQYYLDNINRQCSLCYTAVPHCAYCNSNGTAVECSNCYPDYFLDSPQECKACSEAIPGCNSCRLM